MVDHVGSCTGRVHQGTVVLVLLVHVLSQLGYQSLFMLTVGLKLARDFGKGVQTRRLTTWYQGKVCIRVGSRVVRGHVIVGGLPQSAGTVLVGDVGTLLEQVACQAVGSALWKLLFVNKGI